MLNILDNHSLKLTLGNICALSFLNEVALNAIIKICSILFHFFQYLSDYFI